MKAKDQEKMKNPNNQMNSTRSKDKLLKKMFLKKKKKKEKDVDRRH